MTDLEEGVRQRVLNDHDEGNTSFPADAVPEIMELKSMECTDRLQFRLSTFLFLFEVAMIVLYAVFVDYDTELSGQSQVSTQVEFYYPHYQDVHVMIIIGFGFLYTFMHRYTYSGIGFNLIVACLCIQLAPLTSYFWHKVHDNRWEKPTLNIKTLITSDFAAGSALVAMGVVLGKTNALQLCVMSMLLIPFYGLNEMIGTLKFEAVDMGGSVLLHLFGAMFGLAVAFTLRKSNHIAIGHHNMIANRSTDTFAMVGSLFLFIFWPSFNSALAQGPQRHRVIVNTVLALCASALSALATTRVMRPHRRFDPFDLANAILSGGVSVGSSADLIIGPAVALFIGGLGGFVSVAGFVHIQPFIQRRLKIHDTCGVQILHGLSGLIGGIAGTIAAAVADEEVYGQSIGVVFPARLNGGRSASTQAVMQFAAICTTIGIAAISGLITGKIIRMDVFNPLNHQSEFFTDEVEWSVEDGEEKLIKRDDICA